MIGQSSYKYNILPQYASAFAFDYRALNRWTPSVQVLARALKIHFDVRLTKALTAMSNTYLMLDDGLLFINVYPYPSLTDLEKAKVASYLSELLIVLVSDCADTRGEKCTIVGFGDEADALATTV